MLRRLGVLVVLLFVSATATAQGYYIRTWGTYDRYPYPPPLGGTYSYSAYSPSVTVLDTWGRPIAMPLQPKFLYYDSAIWTPQGWHRPTSITVIPDTRPRYYPVPSRVVEPAPTAAPAPSLNENKAPAMADPVPTVAPQSIERPIPTVPAPNLRPQAKPGLPAIPDVSKLPELPRPPASDDPKLGPSPTPKMK
jgi:hypothetical protein